MKIRTRTRLWQSAKRKERGDETAFALRWVVSKIEALFIFPQVICWKQDITDAIVMCLP